MSMFCLVSPVRVVVLLCSLSLTLRLRVDSHLFQMGQNLAKAPREQTPDCLFASDQKCQDVIRTLVLVRP